MTDSPPPPEPPPGWGTPPGSGPGSPPPPPPGPPGGNDPTGAPPPPPPGPPGAYGPGPGAPAPRPASSGGSRKGLLIGLAVLVVVLLVGGALALVALSGGDDGVAPEDYASDVCGAVGTWQEELQDESDSLEGDLETTDPEEVQDVLVDFLDGAVERTDTLLADVEDFGFPEGDRGEELADDLRGGLGLARDLFQTAADDAGALDPDDTTEFAEGVQQVGEDLIEGGQQVEETFEDLEEEYEDTEASEALSDSDACDDLEGGGLS